jgi:hypothetical protein
MSVIEKAPEAQALTKKDFVTDQEVRWCPGCGTTGFGRGPAGLSGVRVPREARRRVGNRLLEPVPPTT